MTTSHSSHWLQPAFDDPVLDAQVSFRAALGALAEPGLPRAMDRAHALGDLAPATYGLCLAFLDSDTPLWLAPRFDTPLIRANLAFHCGCPIVAEREIALFALLDESELSDLSDFDNGSERYPDQSCTLLIQLDDLHAGPALRWRGSRPRMRKRSRWAFRRPRPSATLSWPPTRGCSRSTGSMSR